MCVFELTASPLNNCLISRLACVVVNWLTMSRAVWLRVFLTPALMPLWDEAEGKKNICVLFIWPDRSQWDDIWHVSTEACSWRWTHANMRRNPQPTKPQQCLPATDLTNTPISTCFKDVLQTDSVVIIFPTSGGFHSQTYIQQQTHYLCLPAEGSLMQSCATLRLPVNIYAGLNQQPATQHYNDVDLFVFIHKIVAPKQQKQQQKKCGCFKKKTTNISAGITETIIWFIILKYCLHFAFFI